MRSTGRWLFWIGLLIVASGVLREFRDNLNEAHAVLMLLLVVLGGSATGGRGLGMVLAVLGSIVIDYAFQTPYDVLSITRSVDMVVILSFIAVAVVTTELLTRAHAEALVASQRADEIVALGVERDRMAEEARAAATLRAASDAKDLVLASVSHDLRTPIATIHALVERSAAAGDPTATAVHEQTLRLSHMVNQVLEHARLRAGAVSLNVEFNLVEDLVGAVIRRSEALDAGRRIAARIDLASPALAGMFDFDGTLRVLGNLIDNALRYSPPGTTVDLEAGRDGSDVFIRVADRGPGIAPHDVPQLFEPLHRSSGSGRAVGGLGLSIAQRLTRLQHGTLEYLPREGGGAVFVLRLPVAALPEARDDESGDAVPVGAAEAAPQARRSSG